MHRLTLTIASVAILALLALSGETVGPAFAALTATPAAPSSTTAPVCDALYDATVANLRAGGSVVTEVPPDGMAETIAEIKILTGEDHAAATRIFGVTLRGEPVFGVEEGGCLLPPIHFAKTTKA